MNLIKRRTRLCGCVMGAIFGLKRTMLEFIYREEPLYKTLHIFKMLRKDNHRIKENEKTTNYVREVYIAICKSIEQRKKQKREALGLTNQLEHKLCHHAKSFNAKKCHKCMTDKEIEFRNNSVCNRLWSDCSWLYSESKRRRFDDSYEQLSKGLNTAQKMEYIIKAGDECLLESFLQPLSKKEVTNCCKKCLLVYPNMLEKKSHDIRFHSNAT